MIRDIETIEKNLLEVKEALDKHGVPFWLAFGTFLGAYRDNKIIPYDWDSDLAIFYEHSLTLYVALNALEKLGYEPVVNSDYSLLMLRKGVPSEKIDLCMFHVGGDKRIWRNIKYDASDFENFKVIKFLGTDWRILNNPEKWLSYTYGSNWREPIKNLGVSDGNPLGK